MSIAPKKLIYMGLEPDMWFEVIDQLKTMTTAHHTLLSDPKQTEFAKDPELHRKLHYLKAIIDSLEDQLTH